MGEYLTSSSSDGEELNMYELLALAKRLNFSFSELKEISFVSLVNILFRSIKSDDEEKQASQSDIDTFF